MFTLLLAIACHHGADDSASESDVVDLRRDIPAAADGVSRWTTPEYIIPAYSERQFCYFLRYDGETEGIAKQVTYQSQYGHHLTVFGTNAEEDMYPDETSFDCTDPDALPMTELDPLFIGTVIGDEGVSTAELPAGMAARLVGDSRIVLQSHYVNTTAKDILVQDTMDLTLMAEDAVETWAAPLVHVDTDFVLPPGQTTSVEVNCSFEEDYNFVFLLGHMHEWGSSYRVDWHHGDATDTIYDIPVWDADYRDVPPLNEYQVGEFAVAAGDSFTTTCTWFNDEDVALEFPQEMCATASMVYPAKVPIICEPE